MRKNNGPHFTDSKENGDPEDRFPPKMFNPPARLRQRDIFLFLGLCKKPATFYWFERDGFKITNVQKFPRLRQRGISILLSLCGKRPTILLARKRAVGNCESSEIRESGNFGNLEIWNFANFQIWELGNLEIRTSENNRKLEKPQNPPPELSNFQIFRFQVSQVSKFRNFRTLEFLTVLFWVSNTVVLFAHRLRQRKYSLVWVAHISERLGF